MPSFKKWFDENYIKGYELDKDILIKGNRIYSPDTCCFVPSFINRLYTSSKNTSNWILHQIASELYSSGRIPEKVYKAIMNR